MNTGDSMYIGPYVPHTFTTRNKDCSGFIIAITYTDKISSDIQNELLDYGEKKSAKFFSDLPKKAGANAHGCWLFQDFCRVRESSVVLIINITTRNPPPLATATLRRGYFVPNAPQYECRCTGIENTRIVAPQGLRGTLPR